VSVDFAEHRGYMPGDDIRRIDWRLYARTDRYYVKEFEADSNANFSVILDVSKSMGFSSGGLSKLDYAKFLAASLTYLANQQRDRVGIVTFDSEIIERVPPSAKHLDVVFHTIDRAIAGRPGLLGDPLFRMTEFFKRRGILALISDFYEEPDTILSAVKQFRAQGHDVMVFHVLDPAELEFPYDTASSFEDMESGERIPIVPENLREQYKKLIEEHTSALAKSFTEQQIDYAVFNTSTPIDYALFAFLSARERMARAR
jgi:uncharacterized protein (DUF58 family)